MDDIKSGARGHELHIARIRRNAPRARFEVCPVLVGSDECPRGVIEALHGPLRDCNRVETLDASSVFGSNAA
jgi:hypothetical protein